MENIKIRFIACIIILLFASVRFTYSQQSDSIRSASDYGASNSLSLGIFGHDFVSVFYRFNMNDKLILMPGVGLKLLSFDGFVESRFSYTVSAGGIYFLKKSLKQKGKRVKVIQSGIYCIGGYTTGASVAPFGPLSMSYVSAGFHYERFKRKIGHSFSVEIGPRISILHSKANYNFETGENTKVLPGLFFTFRYNLFFNKKK